MLFKVGDKVKIVKPFLGLGRNHVGAVVEIVELRTYCSRFASSTPTHYVVKFDCYKIPHIYMSCDIDESCELINKDYGKEITNVETN